MKAVAIIPARGGSKRIPGKNIKSFLGKPIIAYSIEAALKTSIFQRVIVSTDSEDIAAIACQYGAEVPFMRPAELANDLAGTDEVILHVLDWLQARCELPQVACCLYPTAPFVTSALLIHGLAVLHGSDAVTAMSVTHFDFPIYRALRMCARGRMQLIWPENLHRRSQDLPESFHDAGQFYWLNVCRYLQVRSLYNENTVPVMIPRLAVQDIDTLEDWLLAEKLFAAQGTWGGYN